MANFTTTITKTCVIVAMALLAGSMAFAQDTMLTLTNSKTGFEVQFSEEEFLALDQFTMETVNEFVDSQTAFTGPLARDIVALIGADDDDIVTLTAINDYFIDVPVSDFRKYDVVFAHSADGVRLSVRDKGPIWVVYPRSDFPELQESVFNSFLIWQLVSVEIK